MKNKTMKESDILTLLITIFYEIQAIYNLLLMGGRRW